VIGVAVSDAVSVIVTPRAPRCRDAVERRQAGRVVLIPYEPVFTGGLGLEARFGGTSRSCRRGFKPRAESAREVVETADLTGRGR